ncbi:sterol desaturase family protein [Sphingorhabdus sp. Alg239-R122]|uniref:sterol desaturase family protein n=1 Tax=Sphingorhabdus sp. Alg239-R122 TaxID=2305989 RepID=UPI001F0872F2|nr:sterol desaturase family protein [Sphingorhabdus sp. Alg239-R122]
MIFTQNSLVIGLMLVAIFLSLAIAERVWAKRILTQNRWVRWRTHAGFAAVNMPLEKLVQFVVLGGLYALVSGHADGRFGLLQWTDWPVWLEWTIAIFALDFAVWIQHVATHKIPLLWRLHRVHHADRDFDITTALRFHPLEIALSMVYKMVVAVLLGVPLGALILFELLLSLFPLFNHANLALPGWLDRTLRWIVVTPDMHRVHHSTVPHETNSNYGFYFSFWDRIFGVYRAEPEAGQQGMTVGLSEYQTGEPTGFTWSMLLPFRR